jgi:hypothetical protein
VGVTKRADQADPAKIDHPDRGPQAAAGVTALLSERLF